MEFYETDESDVDELLGPHTKSLIYRRILELNQVTNETRKINQNDDDISASKGNNLVSKNEERALGKLDKALQHFCKYGPTTK